MNNDVRRLMESIARDSMRDARKIVLEMCEKETAASNRAFCTRIKNTIQRSASNMMELPANVAGILYKEDVSVSFRPERYFLADREKILADKILSVNSASELLKEAGISYLNATLLFGESGTGKTLFGRYMAYRLGLPFCYVNLSNMVTSLLGGTSKNIEKVFDYVKTEPCVFMLDELDAISADRKSDSKDGCSGEMYRVTVSLMQNLDRLRSDVVVLAATNVVEVIDNALLRRFPTCHEVKRLSQDELVMMGEMFLSDVEAQGKFPVEYSRAELRDMCSKCGKQSDVIYFIIQALAKSIETRHPLSFANV